MERVFARSAPMVACRQHTPQSPTPRSAGGLFVSVVGMVVTATPGRRQLRCEQPMVAIVYSLHEPGFPVTNFGARDFRGITDGPSRVFSAAYCQTYGLLATRKRQAYQPRRLA